MEGNEGVSIGMEENYRARKRKEKKGVVQGDSYRLQSLDCTYQVTDLAMRGLSRSIWLLFRWTLTMRFRAGMCMLASAKHPSVVCVCQIHDQ